MNRINLKIYKKKKWIKKLNLFPRNVWLVSFGISILTTIPKESDPFPARLRSIVVEVVRERVRKPFCCRRSWARGNRAYRGGWLCRRVVRNLYRWRRFRVSEMRWWSFWAIHSLLRDDHVTDSGVDLSAIMSANINNLNLTNKVIRLIKFNVRIKLSLIIWREKWEKKNYNWWDFLAHMKTY